MEGLRKRRPRFRRTSNVPPIRLTERDRVLLRHVEEHRLLRSSHILKLIPGSKQNLLRRLQRLYHHGFLDRPRAQLPYLILRKLNGLVYCLDQEGVTALEDDPSVCRDLTGSREINEEIAGQFLLHTLSVSDIMVAFETACRPPAFVRLLKGTDFLSSSDSHPPPNNLRWYVNVRERNVVSRIGLVPDAAFALDSRNATGEVHRSWYFLEADRGTMPVKRQRLAQSSIYRKALAYIESRRSGTLRDLFGIPAFRVLFVTKDEERMRHMMQACKDANDDRESTMFLFTTEAQTETKDNILSLRWQATNGENVFLP